MARLLNQTWQYVATKGDLEHPSRPATDRSGAQLQPDPIGIINWPHVPLTREIELYRLFHYCASSGYIEHATRGLLRRDWG